MIYVHRGPWLLMAGSHSHKSRYVAMCLYVVYLSSASAFRFCILESRAPLPPPPLLVVAAASFCFRFRALWNQTQSPHTQAPSAQHFAVQSDG